jgi:hypothetical protein
LEECEEELKIELRGFKGAKNTRRKIPINTTF